MRKLFLTLSFLLFSTQVFAAAGEGGDSITCRGSDVDISGELCWDCMYPITIGPAEVVPSEYNNGDTANYDWFICVCPAPPPIYYEYGVAVGYWEPFALSELVRKPGCMPSLDGEQIDTEGGSYGQSMNGDIDDGERKTSFYNSHWYHYPVLEMIGEFSNDLCGNNVSSADIMFMSEWDLGWNDDEVDAIIDGEGAAFANPIAQAACLADCVAATAWIALDVMFWCAGCNGSMYPYHGHTPSHVGGVMAAEVLTERVTSKLHKLTLLELTSTPSAMCAAQTQMIIPKTQYRTQLMIPLPQDEETGCCNPYGRSTWWVQVGKEIPVYGEDFVNAIWRKRNCCVR
jgi:conjugal transfer pilus assembly protein TraU